MSTQEPPKQDQSSAGDDLAAKVQAAMQSQAHDEGQEKKIADLTEQLKKAMEVASRSQAELQNAKMRMEREAAEIRKFAAEAVLLKFLPTIDNLQRALKSLPESLATDAWVKGIVALEQEFLKQVGALGLKRFESLGQEVDAERHEVLMQATGKAGTVVEVLEDGYELHGKVIRPAKVKAGNGE